MDTANYPHLAAVLASGAAYVDGATIVGIAADGVEVSLGVTHAPELAERYLSDFPTPDMW